MLKNLRTIREAAGLSREKLARQADISTVTIENIERGLGCRVDTARKLADALGVSVEELMGNSEKATA
jgi:transcriptional regulator with XRE-family HTH domain